MRYVHLVPFLELSVSTVCDHRVAQSPGSLKSLICGGFLRLRLSWDFPATERYSQGVELLVIWSRSAVNHDNKWKEEGVSVDQLSGGLYLFLPPLANGKYLIVRAQPCQRAERKSNTYGHIESKRCQSAVRRRLRFAGTHGPPFPRQGRNS